MKITFKQCTGCGHDKPLTDFYNDKHKFDGKCVKCKPCMKAQTKRYVEANKATVRKRQRNWRNSNPELTREKATALRRLNPKRYAAYQAAYRKRHPAMATAWMKRNPDKVREIRRRWARNNPALAVLQSKISRLKRRGVPGSHTKQDIDRLWKLQKGKCAVCRADLLKTGKHIDHVVPLARGGDNGRLNLQLLCPTCNHRKSAKDPIHFMQQMGRLL